MSIWAPFVIEHPILTGFVLVYRYHCPPSNWSFIHWTVHSLAVVSGTPGCSRNLFPMDTSATHEAFVVAPRERQICCDAMHFTLPYECISKLDVLGYRKSSQPHMG